MLISASNTGPQIYIKCGQLVSDQGSKWEIGGRMSELEYLHNNREVLSESLLVYLIGDQKAEVNCWVNTWTDNLAEIFYPGSVKVNLVQENLREI